MTRAKEERPKVSPIPFCLLLKSNPETMEDSHTISTSASSMPLSSNTFPLEKSSAITGPIPHPGAVSVKSTKAIRPRSWSLRSQFGRLIPNQRRLRDFRIENGTQIFSDFIGACRFELSFMGLAEFSATDSPRASASLAAIRYIPAKS